MATKQTRFNVEDVDDSTAVSASPHLMSCATSTTSALSVYVTPPSSPKVSSSDSARVSTERLSGNEVDGSPPRKVVRIVRDFEISTPTSSDGGNVSSPTTQPSLNYTDTVERVPMTMFYRQDSGNTRGHGRPTLRELHDPIPANKSGNRVSEGDSHDLKFSQQQKSEVKFGWIRGVLVRCLLNIWGVMLFLRLTWVVGQAGIGLTVLIIALSSVVTIITTLSMSAICTNGEVKGGGAYYLISRSLGPEFGGAIGIIFSFANAVGVALYVVGFAETVRDLLKDNNSLMTDEINDVRIVGVITVTLLLVLALVGMEWEARAQLLLLGILLLSIANFVIGTFIGPKSTSEETKGFVGYKGWVYVDNWYPDFQGETFFSVFAVFFPAATGILAGANISGDLKDAQKAIPKGTLLAIVISSIVYGIAAWMAGSCVIRDATGPLNATIFTISGATVFPNCSTDSCLIDTFGYQYYQNCSFVNGKCLYGLLHQFQVMEMVSGVGEIITAGIFSATLSSALASLVSAPRVFQAVCKDRLFPYIQVFATGGGRSGHEPIRGYILTFVVALGFIVIGELNGIAPIISNFFLMSYALINYSCFNASFAKSPGWRPAFKYYNQWVALFGSLLCIAIMFVIEWWMALITIAIVGLLFGYVAYKKPDVNWGSSSAALLYVTALKASQKLQQTEDHVKNFSLEVLFDSNVSKARKKPQLLVLTGLPSSRPDLSLLACQINKNVGAVTCGQVLVGPFESHRMARETCKRDIFIKSAKLKAFHSVVTSHSLRQGIQSLMEVAGLGKLRPNTLMLGYKNQWMLQEQTVVNEYVDILHDAFDLNFGVAILRMPDGLYGDASVPLQLAELVDAGISAEQNDTMERAETKQLGQKLRSQLGPHGDLGRTNLNESSQQNSRDGRLSTLMQKQKSYFSERQPKGTIDVWWLYDDGGLTVLLPHLLSLSPSWSRCRIRIFAPVTEQLSTEEVRMTSLLRKFRISFSSVIMLSEMKSRPSSESVEEFMKLPGGEESNREDVKEKTFRHIRLGELLRQHSTNAKLIVVTMPIPRKNTCSSILYMSWLETISCKLPPILFVRGNQQSVLTFQS